MSARRGDEGHRWRVTDPLHRWVCGLYGHELLRSYEPGRICLRCTSCSYETRGWILDERRHDAAPRPAAAPALLSEHA
jgi:hypothetical protein